MPPLLGYSTDLPLCCRSAAAILAVFCNTTLPNCLGVTCVSTDDKSHLREEGLVLAHSSRGSRSLEQWSVRRWRWLHVADWLPFLPSHSPGSQARNADNGKIFTHQLKQSRYSPTGMPEATSQASLEPARLTVNTKHHTFLPTSF